MRVVATSSKQKSNMEWSDEKVQVQRPPLKLTINGISYMVQGLVLVKLEVQQQMLVVVVTTRLCVILWDQIVTARKCL